MHFKNIITLSIVLLAASCKQGIHIHKKYSVPVSNSVANIKMEKKRVEASKQNSLPDDYNFVPKTKNRFNDQEYMEDVYNKIDAAARKFHDTDEFSKIVMATAWTESRWEHYSYNFPKKDKINILVGDAGKAIGMLQINTRWHPRLEDISKNINYGTEMLKDLYAFAKKHKCSHGTNKGTSLDAVLRRVYASYNGGTDDACRDNDKRDEKFRNFFYKAPWLDYI